MNCNQNARDRIIAAAWTVRARPGAPVSTPVTWNLLREVKSSGLAVVPPADYLGDIGD